MTTTRLLAVLCCLALLVAPASAHPGHGHVDGDANDYALHVDGSVPSAGLPAGAGLDGLVPTPVSAVVGALRGETVSASVWAPPGDLPALELRDATGRVVATPAVDDGRAAVGLGALASGSYVLALVDGQGSERDAVAVVVSDLGASHTAIDRADAGTAVPVQVTVSGAASAVDRVDVVLASDADATVVPAAAVRTGLHAATLRLDVRPGSYRLFAVVRGADGTVAAVTEASAFEVYTVEGTRAPDTAARSGTAPAAPTPAPAAGGTGADGQSAGSGVADGASAPAPSAAGLERAGLVAPGGPSLPIVGGLAAVLAAIAIAVLFVRRAR